MKLKTFETFNDFNNDNSKIYIIGIPSGEALQVTRDALDDLVCLKLVHYTMKYSEIGFFAFDDKDIVFVMKYVDPKPKNVVPKFFKKELNNITIINSDFDHDVMDGVSEIIDEYPTCVDLYVQDNFMGITYDDYYLEIEEIKERSPKYLITKSWKETRTNRYMVVTNKDIINRIKIEMFEKKFKET